NDDPGERRRDEDEESQCHNRVTLKVCRVAENVSHGPGNGRARMSQSVQIPRRDQVARVVREGHQDSHQDEPDTGNDTDPQNGADRPLHVSHPLAPFNSICTETQISRRMNTTLMLRLSSRPSSRTPICAPSRTPTATGPATNGSMSP